MTLNGAAVVVQPVISHPGPPAGLHIALHATVPFDTLTHGGPWATPSGANIKGRKAYFGTQVGILVNILSVFLIFLADFLFLFAFFIFMPLGDLSHPWLIAPLESCLVSLLGATACLIVLKPLRVCSSTKWY